MARVITNKIPYHLCTFSSKYDQRMRRLSCKIFNDFYIPEKPIKDFDYGVQHPPLNAWFIKWHNDILVYERNQARPIDLDSTRNHKYYVAHPQIRLLTHLLREYGLFRDEHRDFNDLMKEVAIARGKVPSERRGPNDKSKKKK